MGDHGPQAPTEQASLAAHGPAKVRSNPSCSLTVPDPPNRSGKSSIMSVVFHKLEPQETLFLESTTRIQKDTMK